MENDIKIIGFDADDTLWINEPFYQNAENEFCEILKPYFKQIENIYVFYVISNANAKKCDKQIKLISDSTYGVISCDIVSKEKLKELFD